MKTITINKTVVKKNGEDLKSEETFYAGIFKDEDCTQLADGVSPVSYTHLLRSQHQEVQ